MKATVDPDTCIGCELCPTICPEVFQMGDDGLAHAIKDNIAQELESAVHEAAQSCPVQAIKIT